MLASSRKMPYALYVHLRKKILFQRKLSLIQNPLIQKQSHFLKAHSDYIVKAYSGIKLWAHKMPVAIIFFFLFLKKDSFCTELNKALKEKWNAIFKLSPG